MDRKFLKKFMSRAGWRISDARLFMEHITDPATHEPNLPELTLLHLVGRALSSLRHDAGWVDHDPLAGTHEALDQKLDEKPREPGPEFRWDQPWVELRYPVAWDWSRGDAVLESPFKMSASPQEDRLSWLIKTSRRQEELLIFEVLTHGAAQRRSNSHQDFIVPNPHHSDLINEALQSIPPEQHQKWIDEYLKLLLKPFTVGFMNDFEDEKDDHIVRRLERVPAVRFDLPRMGMEGTVIVQVHPLTVDASEKRAFYPVVVGISLWPRGRSPRESEQLLWKADPSAVSGWSAEQGAEVWKAIESALDAIENSYRTRPEVGIDASEASLSLSLPTPEIVALRQGGRYLLEGPTLIDKGAATLVAYAHGLNLPRKWTAIRTWDDLVQQETDRLQNEHGREAFEARVGTGRGGRGRGALLISRMRPSGENVVELSEEAAQALAERENVRGYRKQVRDEDGVIREYLIKRLPTPTGHIEIRLSWYGQAWPLVDDAIAYRHSSLKELQVRSGFGQPSLFEELEERHRADINGHLRQMEAIRDARLVMDLILRSFGRDGENPLHIPAWQLRALLECESDINGFARVQGCLRALQEIRFYVHATRNGPGATPVSFGPFLGDVSYIGRGKGEHTDGDFYLQVSPGAIGCLQVFGTAQYKANNTQRVLTYNWNQELSKENREELTGYIKGFLALAPYYDRAKGFTPTQSNLLRWIEQELTLNKDAVRKDHGAKRASTRDATAEETRLYGADFCPLLPRGLHFCATLGHFTRNPETGRKLHGGNRPSKANSASQSLLAVMGHTLPSSRSRVKRSAALTEALQDLRAVVEEALGGYVVAWAGNGNRDQGRWLSLQEAVELPEKTLLHELSWFLFVAPDFRERLATDLEKYHADRFARGKSPYQIRVTRQREEADKGHLQAAGEHFEHESDFHSIRQRLKIAREQRGLSQAKIATLFGVSQKAIDYWEKGPLADETGRVRGKPIPEEMLPYIMRWIDTGQAPNAQELAARTTRRTGVRRL